MGAFCVRTVLRNLSWDFKASLFSAVLPYELTWLSTSSLDCHNPNVTMSVACFSFTCTFRRLNASFSSIFLRISALLCSISSLRCLNLSRRLAVDFLASRSSSLCSSVVSYTTIPSSYSVRTLYMPHLQLCLC